jgi:tetratricopeptide (TPR) repeat protein
MTDETQPNNLSETQPGPVKRPSRVGLLLGLLVLIVALGLGGMAGYGQGVNERINAQGTLVGSQLGEQFSLVQQDLDAGRYSVARQRLEYIIQQDPSFPGAADKLAEVMVNQAITPTPVPSNTPTITPTPDLRSQETIFADAEQKLKDKDWTALMGLLDSLRKADPTYKAVFVDGMYYTALRNRGVDQIMGIGAYKTVNMEAGIYDITIAERFGPIDGYAGGLVNGAKLYIIASSFWDVNWQQAVEYFRQVYSYTPNLRDASNYTAGQRLAEALLKYGDQISATGSLGERCKALDLWDESARITPLNNVYSNKYNDLNLQCHPPTELPTAILPTEVVTLVPTQVVVPPTTYP